MPNHGIRAGWGRRVGGARDERRLLAARDVGVDEDRASCRPAVAVFLGVVISASRRRKTRASIASPDGGVRLPCATGLRKDYP
jgi:hypothetical protein